MSNKVWNYLRKVVNDEGVAHLTLIDPDPAHQTPSQAGQLANLATKAGSDAIMVGGSTSLDVDETVTAIKDQTEVPIILFPGNITGISKHADAVFFMSVFNASHPYWVVGAQALAAPTVKKIGIEAIPMAYLIVEPGGTAGYVSGARLIPRNKPEIAASYALAAQYMGFKLVYLEGGSGVEAMVPPEMISTVSKTTDIPIIVGGGINTTKEAVSAAKAGARMIVQGTFVEKTVFRDKGQTLGEIIRAIKQIRKGEK
ncbi:MAG: geranylgeranylglyceryl/heptaprenylglyceryl phosphate synthase [Candidatus Hodarchaeota archaeon]